MFSTTELSAHRSRDLNFSDFCTNAKPRLGAEQIAIERERQFLCFDKIVSFSIYTSFVWFTHLFLETDNLF